MKDMLPPGLYDTVINGFARSKTNLRMKLALANLRMMGTVMYEIRLHDDNLDMITHGWPYKVPRAKRSLRNRHYKAKAQPNCGPRGNNPW